MAHPVEVTDATFEEEVIKADTPVLVDFWADWCAPCKIIAPIVEELAEEYEGRIKFGKVDVDANPRVATSYGIRGIPTLLIFNAGSRWTRWLARCPSRRSRSASTRQSPTAPSRVRGLTQARERMGPGGLRGLQLRWPRPFGRGGGFDSLSLPPYANLRCRTRPRIVANSRLTVS